MNAIKIPVAIAAFVLAPLLSSFGQTTIFVSGGSFSAPYYNFSLDENFSDSIQYPGRRK